MKPIKAWAIKVIDVDGEMLTSPNGVPELFSTREETRNDIRRWVAECGAEEWKPRAVRVTITVEDAP